MIISNISPGSLKLHEKNSYDVVICASGYESRSAHLARLLGNLNCRKIVIGFEESRQGGAREENDALYKQYGYEMHYISESSSAKAETILQNVLSKLPDKGCSRLLLDISSMTRAWYGAFVRTLWIEERIGQIETDFFYIPAEFPAEIMTYPPNEIFSPVRGFSSLSLADKSTVLIIGLGVDYGRAVGIKEEIDPKKTIVFYADPASDKRYFDLTLSANSDLLSMLEPDLRFGYPLNDTQFTYNILESVCSGYLKDYRIVLTSLGPKIFGLICFLIASKYPEISVWRVSAGKRGNIEDHKPSNQVVGISVSWANSASR